MIMISPRAIEPLKRVWRPFRTIGLGILAGCVVYFGLIDREPPRENIRGFPSKPAFHAGEFFNGTWIADWTGDFDGRVIRWLTSDCNENLVANLPSEDIRVISQKPRVFPTAEWTVSVAPFQIPAGFPACKAYYHLRAEFYRNWFQWLFPIFAVPVDYPVIPFDVLPPLETSELPPPG